MKLFTRLFSSLLVILVLGLGGVQQCYGQITVGTGTVTSTSNPISTNYGFNYSQQLYLKTEIGGSGNISSISFFRGATGAADNSSNWTILMGHTGKTSFASSTDWVPVASMSTVYSGTVTFSAVNNWMTITLDTPFNYNNVDNLVIAVDENEPGFSNGSIAWGATTVTNSCINYRHDNTNPNPSAPPSGTRTSSRPNVILGGITSSNPPNCTIITTPANLAANVALNGNITFAAAPGATSYDVYLGTNNPPTTLLGNFTTNTAAYTGLSSNTQYFVQIVPKNSVGSASGCPVTNFTTVPPPPANDNTSGAIAMTISPTGTCTNAISGTTASATNSPEYVICSSSYNDVWYTITPTQTGNHTFSRTLTTGTSTTYLAVWSGTPGALTRVNSSCFSTTFSQALTAGITYYVNVATINTGFVNFDLCVSAPAPPPVNDECSTAVNINGGGVPGNPTGAAISATTAGATQSLPAIVCNSFTGTADDDIWFTFTTDADGGDFSVTVVGGTGFDAVVDVMTGACGSTVNVACADVTGSAGTETATVTGAAANTTYYVRVYDYGTGFTGSLNDRAAGAFTIGVSGSALPVELLSFTGQAMEKSNKLTWKTATEENAGMFIVERSADGRTGFEAIAEVKAAGNSLETIAYTAEDVNPLGMNYYRLKMVDLDGTFEYSSVVTVERKDKGVHFVNVFPVPTTAGVTVVYTTPEVKDITVVVTDLMGRNMQTLQLVSNKGVNNQAVDMTAMPAGTYFISITDGVSQQVRRITKQ